MFYFLISNDIKLIKFVEVLLTGVLMVPMHVCTTWTNASKCRSHEQHT